MLKAIKNFVRQRSRHAQQITPQIAKGTGSSLNCGWLWGSGSAGDRSY